MQQFLYKYLVLQRKLSIPGLGCFNMINEHSHIDESNGLIFPPKPIIEFEVKESTENDLQLVNFLSEQMNIDEEKAMMEFQDFTSQFKRNLQEQSLVILAGVGRLNKTSNGKIRFTPETNLLEFLPPIEIEKHHKLSFTKPIKLTLSEDVGTDELITVEDIRQEKNDYWWIYALVLILIGVIALLLYS